MPSYSTSPDVSPCSPILITAFLPVFSFSSFSAFLQPICVPKPYRVSGKLQLPSSQPDQPPVYVNPRQYHRILKRRLSRGVGTPHCRDRSKTYRHESRHRHACSRQRGPKGMFLTKKEGEIGGKIDCRPDIHPLPEESRQTCSS